MQSSHLYISGESLVNTLSFEISLWAGPTRLFSPGDSLPRGKTNGAQDSSREKAEAALCAEDQEEHRRSARKKTSFPLSSFPEDKEARKTKAPAGCGEKRGMPVVWKK